MRSAAALWKFQVQQTAVLQSPHMLQGEFTAPEAKECLLLTRVFLHTEPTAATPLKLLLQLVRLLL